MKYIFLTIMIAVNTLTGYCDDVPLACREYNDYKLTHLLTPAGPVPTANDPDGVYPYVSFSETSNRPVLKQYRYIDLENRWIRVTICPDLGGKVISIIHKKSGKETLYVPDVIRYTRILPRFYFVAGGIGASFPISHSPTQNVPVLYRIDRTAERVYVTCGERELRFGMQWSLEYSLGKDDEFLTQRIVFHNPGKEPYPWMTFGIDLLIGEGADSLISHRQEMFLPVKLMNALDSAYVVDDNLEQRPIVSFRHVIIQSSETDDNGGRSWSSPMKLGIVLLIHALVFGIYGIISKRRFGIFFGLIYLQATIIGLIIWFVALFSVHPCTFPNFNMYFFHPFYLIAFLGYVLPKTYRLATWFHWINFVLLPMLLIAWPFTLQNMNTANIPYILCLWIGSGVWLKVKKI